MELLYDWKGSHARHGLINAAIRKFGYTRYLEIGCRDDKCFSKIMCPVKVGIDPEKGGTIRTTSDEYFADLDARVSQERFDVVFVDGLHLAEQVIRDVDNSLRYLSPNGLIVLHDCLPAAERHQVRVYRGGAWNGDVWKAAVQLRTRSDVDVAVGVFDCGVAAVRPRSNTDQLDVGRSLDSDTMFDLTWDEYVANRDEWLRTMSYEELINWL